MEKPALFGAAGASGDSIAASLRAQGRPYRVVGRSREALEQAFGRDPLAEIVTWDPQDSDSVRAAAEGIDTIFYTVGVPYWQFDLHPQLMRATLDGAIAAGVERFLLIGTVYPYGRPRSERVAESHPRDPHTRKGHLRKVQEDMLFEEHAAGRIRATELRLPDFYGPNVEKSFVYGAFRAALGGGRASLVGPLDTPHQFVFTPDVGAVATALSAQQRAHGRAWDFAGSGVISQREFVRPIFAAAGKPPRTLVANEAVLRIAGLFDRMMRELVEMHYLHTTPVIMDDAALRD